MIRMIPEMMVKAKRKFRASESTEAKMGPRIDPKPKNPVLIALQ